MLCAINTLLAIIRKIVPMIFVQCVLVLLCHPFYMHALQYALQHFLVVPCTTSGPAFSLISTQKEGVRAFDGSIVPWLCPHTCQPNYFMHVTHCIADCAFSKYTKHLMSLNNPNSHSPLPTSKTYVLH